MLKAATRVPGNDPARAGAPVAARSSDRAAGRAAEPPSLVPAPAAGVLTSGSRVTAALGAGMPLAPAVRSVLERGFGADLGAVRVHEGDAAARAANIVGARAFATGTHVVLGTGASSRDVELLGHEVAHVLQQGGAAPIRPFTPRGGDHFEREASHAASVVSSGGSVPIQAQAGVPGVQGLGLGTVLDFFADKANLIPGFRMFTIVLGVNPINMNRVERSTANILRALLEFIPGGALLRMALDNYGIIDRVGAWLEEQIRAFGLSGDGIRQALDRFLGTLGLSDVFSPGDVWERAKRIFSEPIDRILGAVQRIASGMLRLIKDAVLLPLARLAEKTRGYDLLKAVLGRDPITGEPVPRNAETLIGGFMKFIGQEEVWKNLVQARAVPRAWAWFQGALSGLMGFVGEFPALVVRAFQSLELSDVVLLPRALSKIAAVFGDFAGRFVSWGGTQVMSLLQIIFEVLAPAVMPYINKAASAFKTIVSDPVRFIGNLVKAALQGFRQFGDNFLTHLRTSLIGWLTGAMAGSNVYIPQAFSPIEILKFVLSVLGLTWQSIRQKLVKRVGETVVTVLETGFDIVVTLVRDGPAAAWQKILETLDNLREMAIGAVMNFVRDRIVQAAITKLLSMLNPAGAFIQAVIAIYNTIMFFVERLRQIAQVVASFIDSISAIASGVVAAAADRVERTMGGLLTLVISFLARIVGLGKVSDAVNDIIAKIRAPIDRALERVVDWIVEQAKRLGKAVASGAKKLFEWWKARKQFKTSGGESHALYFTGSGASARLTLASDPISYEDFIKGIKAPGKATEKKAAVDKAIELDKAVKDVSSKTATNKKPPDIEELLGELALLTATLLSGTGNPSSEPVFGPLAGGFGTSGRVARLTKLKKGGRPTVSDGLWPALNMRRVGSDYYYVRGHLLNEHLGGVGNTWSNLTPLTQDANNRSEQSMLNQFESSVKEKVAEIEKAKSPDAYKFEVKVNYGRQHPLANLVASLRAGLNKYDPKIADIIEAERHVPMSIDCLAERIGADGGKPQKADVIRHPVKNLINTDLTKYQVGDRPREPFVIADKSPAELQKLDGVDATAAKAIAQAKPRSYEALRQAAGFTKAELEQALDTPGYYVRLYSL
jgi:hypothetical protein